MSTFVLPTFVADGSLVTGDIRVPTYVADGSLVTGNMHMPPYANAARTDFFVPPYAAGLVYFVHVPTGGVKVGGAAAVVGDPFIPTGGVKVGGTAPVVHNIAFAPTGGVKVGGAATVVFIPVNIYDIGITDAMPQGGVKVSGGALIQDNIPWIPTGGVKVGGGAAINERINYIPSGGVQIGGAAVVQTVYSILASGGVQVGGSAPVTVAYAVTPTGGVKVGGSAVVADRQAWFAPSGGVKVGGSAIAFMKPYNVAVTTENPYADNFPGWAINYETYAPSRYMGLPANSMAQMGGNTYVANAGGIYLVGADSDAGVPIASSVTFATTDYQDSHEKRMEYAYIGVRSAIKMKLKVHVNRGEPQYYVLMPNKDAKTKGTRVPIGKGLVGRYWGARLDNMSGGDFDLESVEFSPIAQQRHGA